MDTCIVDFAGNNNQTGFWYDYIESEKLVRFGGSLRSIPDLKIEIVPSEDDCEEWINSHSDLDFRRISKLDVMIILDMDLSGSETLKKIKEVKIGKPKLKKIISEKYENTAADDYLDYLHDQW